MCALIGFSTCGSSDRTTISEVRHQVCSWTIANKSQNGGEFEQQSNTAKPKHFAKFNSPVTEAPRYVPNQASSRGSNQAADCE